MSSSTISPAEIHEELAKIWDSLEGSNKMRASLFNLIFYTKRNERADYIRLVSQKVIEKFPSRVIFITEGEDDAKDEMVTRVSVLTSEKAGSDIACDQIDLEVSGKMRERTPFVILPHILPDLPVYVIWADNPQNPSPLLGKLQTIATRLIFDSELAPNLPAFAKNLIDFEKGCGLDIADLNWARMESWRELLASTFYTLDRLSMLKKTEKVQILYNSQEPPFYSHTQVQAIYLQGWLASQLGWTLIKIEKDVDTLHLIYDRDGAPLTVDIYPEKHDNLKPGAIISLDIETEDQDHFSFGRNLETPHLVSMRFSTLKKCDIPLRYIFAKDESGQSLVKEICHKGTSLHFFNLLAHIQNY